MDRFCKIRSTEIEKCSTLKNASSSGALVEPDFLHK